MRTPLFPFVMAALTMTLVVPSANAQVPKPHVVNGVVRRLVGRDSVPEPRAQIVLHRVGRSLQGPVDSTLADAAGRFSFTFVPDTSALYLVSGRNSGIEYFSSPVPLKGGGDSLVSVLMYDTTSAAKLTLDFRNLVVNRGSADGARRVLELLILKNPGTKTVIGRDSLDPTWSMPIAKGALAFEPGPGDFSPEAVQLRNDSLVVFSPVSPGDKQIIVEYTLRGTDGPLTLPFTPASSVNLLLEDRNAKIKGIPLVAADSDRIQGKVYQRYAGAVAVAGLLSLDVPSPRAAAKQLVWWLVGALVLTLLVASGLLLMARPRPSVEPIVVRPRSAGELIESIAQIEIQLRDPALSEGERRLLVADRVALTALARTAIARAQVGV